jgi:hypothetical protein
VPAHLVELAEGLAVAIVCEGEIVGGDLTQATLQLLAWDDERLHHLYAGMIDLSKATGFNVDTAKLDSIVELDMRLARKVRQGFLVAVAAPRDLQFGISRMWQTLAEHTGWEILVVRDRREALAWLRARGHAKFGVDLPLE